MTTQNARPSALEAALTAPYKRRELLAPIAVLLAGALVGLQAMVFVLSALLHASNSDAGTALALGPGVVGAIVVAVGLIRGYRVAYVMAMTYALVSALLLAVFEHQPSVPAIALLVLLGTNASRRFFFTR